MSDPVPLLNAATRNREPLERVAVAARVLRVAARIIVSETGAAVDAGASETDLAMALGLTADDRGGDVETALETLRGWA